MNISTKTRIGILAIFGLSAQITFSQEMQEKRMTIQELGANVIANNIQLKIASTNVDVAEARISEVKTNRLPDIGADVKAYYLSDVTLYDTKFNKVQSVDIPNFGNQFNLSATQLLFAGGKINKSIALAGLSKTLSENQLGDTEQGVKLNATELFLRLYNLLLPL